MVGASDLAEASTAKVQATPEHTICPTAHNQSINQSIKIYFPSNNRKNYNVINVVALERLPEKQIRSLKLVA